ncbi:hypothetical protein [Pantanalinema sp. GBBB05]|uniref:hypothetical protein n=1 Tax=Pantanalinema sp. GBBB05 TaxID=2604139 RepID=UPI001D48C16B|nr:hypothetical protein [Pantanalinema sp. GBBB05]
MKEELQKLVNQYDDPEELLLDIAEILKQRAKFGEQRWRQQQEPDSLLKTFIDNDRKWAAAIETMVDEGGFLIED